MKCVAFIQLAAIIGGIVIPDGRTFWSSGDCGCSSAAQAAGTCCCSAAQARCCSGSEKAGQDSQTSCCSRERKNGCGSSPAAGRRRQHSGDDTKRGAGFQSRCPCGVTVQFVIMHQPRLRPAVTARPVLTQSGRLPLQERLRSGRIQDAPIPRPPNAG